MERRRKLDSMMGCVKLKHDRFQHLIAGDTIRSLTASLLDKKTEWNSLESKTELGS
jgi:hypothetical protein